MLRFYFFAGSPGDAPVHSPSNHVVACPLKTPGEAVILQTLQHDNACARVETSDWRASLPSGAAVDPSSVLPPSVGLWPQSCCFFSPHRATSKGFQTASVWKPSNCSSVTVEGLRFSEDVAPESHNKGFCLIARTLQGCNGGGHLLGCVIANARVGDNDIWF